jgi:cytochrome c551/c552
MKRAISFFVITAITAITGLSNTASAQEKPAIPAAFETRFCEACHAIDKKMVGPALKDIALKYKDKADAVEYLKAKIKNGGQGVWGNIPMPASASATDAEIAELTAWILNIGK